MQRRNRLTNRADFSKIYRHGKSAANHQFVVYHKKQPASPEGGSFRLGISVSKKIGNAVVRNRLRRVIKEIVRHNGEFIVPGTDFIIIVRKPAAEMDYAEMEKSLIHAMKRASVYDRTKSVR